MMVSASHGSTRCRVLLLGTITWDPVCRVIRLVQIARQGALLLCCYTGSKMDGTSRTRMTDLICHDPDDRSSGS